MAEINKFLEQRLFEAESSKHKKQKDRELLWQKIKTKPSDLASALTEMNRCFGMVNLLSIEFI